MTLTMDQVWTLIFCGWLYGLLSALAVVWLMKKWKP